MLKVNSWLFGFVFLLQASFVTADYSEHPKAIALMDKMETQYGMDRTELQLIFTQAEKEQRILDSMQNAAEKTKSWPEYRRHFIREQRVTGGVDFWQKHAATLARAEAEYGVPPELIVAILGVETNYGGFTGRTSVLNALSTLAFEHPRRSPFFTSELENYLLLVKEQGWQAGQQQGSYAGAMGYAQFMPSNYRTLAVDFNGDGKIDLFNAVDAIGSVANYFVHHGWRAGEPVTVQLEVAADYNPQLASDGLKPNLTVEALAEGGFVSPLPLDPLTPAVLVYFDGGEEPDQYWLGLNNFYAISRYNPRSKYAMAVYHLSQEIKARS